MDFEITQIVVYDIKDTWVVDTLQQVGPISLVVIVKRRISSYRRERMRYRRRGEQ